METAKTCKRVLLAGNDGCRVLYCNECKVAEIEVGALSLRLEAQAFKSLSELLQEAVSRISLLNGLQESQGKPKNPVWSLH